MMTKVGVQEKAVDIDVGHVSVMATDINQLSADMAVASNLDAQVDTHAVETTVDSVSSTFNQVGMY